MPTCDEFEVQIEQQAHGALAATEGGVLQGHLAECVNCRSFAALVRQVERQLAGRAADAERSLVWRECERRVERMAPGMRLLPWTLGAMCLFIPGSLLPLVRGLLAGREISRPVWVMEAMMGSFFA